MAAWPGRPWWLRWPPELQRRAWAAAGRCPRCGSSRLRRRDSAPRVPGGGRGGAPIVEGGCYEPAGTPNAICLRCGFRFTMIG